MEQESISKRKCNSIAIIGAGPAGCVCAYYLLKAGYDVSIFDGGKFLRTLLPTGGGRCNLAHAEFDFKELAKNYPRGEKFLYSVFSKFSTSDTLAFFDEIGVKTYTQDDNRIFPISNSSEDVKTKILKSIQNATFIKEKVEQIEKLTNGYKLKTNKSIYAFDIVVVAIGGHSKFEIFNPLNINIITPTQALVGLTTKENFAEISGVSLKNVTALGFKNIKSDDILFTHRGITGPLIYKISSLKARDEFPYKLSLKLVENFDLQDELNKNSQKEIKNLLGQYVPKSFAIWLLEDLQINPETPCHKINGNTRNQIMNKLQNFEITITGKVPDGEVVTCGGVDLKEVNPKTLENKQHKNLYFCGEVLDIDGFCVGFNLQNCWSTGYIVAQSIINK
ncbi:aminoacetone oxidase family FAD-binding enzyme [bacterium]|nr:aminoacetone oxidase family FAD-binding enzyme [bacterium]